MKSHVHLLLAPGAVLDFSDNDVETQHRYIRGEGSVATGVTLSSNGTQGSNTMALSSVTGLAAGDLLLVSSDDTVDETQPTKKAELVYITSISGTTLTLKGALADTYLTSDNAVAQKVTSVYNCSVRGGKIVGTGRTATSIGDTGISFVYAELIRVEGVELVDCDRVGVGFVSCIDFSAKDVTLRFPEKGANGDVQYGVATNSACRNGLVQGCSCYLGKHAWVFGHNDEYPGIQREVTYRDCDAYGLWDDAWVTHGSTNGCFFVGGVAQGCAGGIDIRSPNMTVDGCRVVDAQTSTCVVLRYRFSGLRMRGVYTQGGGGGLATASGTIVDDPTDIELADCTFEGMSGIGIRLLALTFSTTLKRWRFSNVVVKDGGTSANHDGVFVEGAIQLDWYGGLVENFGGEGVNAFGLRNSTMRFTINNVGQPGIRLADLSSPAVVADWNDFRGMRIAGYGTSAVFSSAATGANNQLTPAMDHGAGNNLS
jgi:hypothetical protein